MIEFNEEKHIYKVDGIVKPSVSEILSLIFGHTYDSVPERILRNKINIGKKVHKFIEGKGGLTASILPYIAEYQNFLKENTDIDDGITGHEQMFCNDDYCGTVDILTVDSVIDIKTTSKINKSAYFQVAAYQILTGKQKGYILQLTKDSYHFVEVDSKYQELWNCLLKIYKEVQ